jgi:uncharacterized phage protein (TIGR02218 family)
MLAIAPRAEEFRVAKTKRWVRCWKLARKDGEVKRFTNHSGAVEAATSFAPFTLETFSPIAFTVNRESSRRIVGPVAETDSIAGFILDTGWTPEDARVGLFSDVRVDVWDVDWRYPWAGYLSHAVYYTVDVEWSGEAISFRLATIAQRADVKVGRIYELRCDATLGDDRCQKDISGLMSGTRSVTGPVAGKSPRLAFESNLTTPSDGYWKDGTLEWLTGTNAIAGANSRQVKVSRTTNGQIQLWTPTPYDIDVGDTFRVSPGCNKLFKQHCVDKFSNGVNHRGFRFLAGMDKVVEGPDSPI